MPLDKEQRKKRAREAGKQSGISRSKGHKERNKNICCAHDYLTQNFERRANWDRGYQFIVLLRREADDSKPSKKRLHPDPNESPLRFIGEKLGLSAQRIDQILKKRDM